MVTVSNPRCGCEESPARYRRGTCSSRLFRQSPGRCCGRPAGPGPAPSARCPRGRRRCGAHKTKTGPRFARGNRGGNGEQCFHGPHCLSCFKALLAATKIAPCCFLRYGPGGRLCSWALPQCWRWMMSPARQGRSPPKPWCPQFRCRASRCWPPASSGLPWATFPCRPVPQPPMRAACCRCRPAALRH